MMWKGRVGIGAPFEMARPTILWSLGIHGTPPQDHHLHQQGEPFDPPETASAYHRGGGSSSSAIPPSLPSRTPCIRDIVLSRLLLRLVGLIMVVECLLMTPPALEGLTGLVRDVRDGVDEVLILDRVDKILPGEIFFPKWSLTPLGVIGWYGDWRCSGGGGGTKVFPSSGSTSIGFGGRRSFSRSDLRLCITMSFVN